MRNCYFIAALSERLPCRASLSSSSFEERLSRSTGHGAPSLPLPFAHWVTHTVFCAHPTSCDSQQSMFACWRYKSGQTALFSCQDGGWMTWPCANTSGECFRSHICRVSSALWWNTHTLVRFLSSCHVLWAFIHPDATTVHSPLVFFIQEWINDVRAGSFSGQGNHIKASSKLVAFNVDQAGKAQHPWTTSRRFLWDTWLSKCWGLRRNQSDFSMEKKVIGSQSQSHWTPPEQLVSKDVELS